MVINASLFTTLLIGVSFAVYHHSVTPELYTGALHRKLGFVLVATLLCCISFRLCQALFSAIEDEDTRKHGRFTRLPQDVARVTSPTNFESTRSSETLYRTQSSLDGRDLLEDAHQGSAPQCHPKGWYPPRGCLSRGFVIIGTVFKVILYLGLYAQILLGIATFTALFTDHEVFNGVAHWAKASVFFLFGIWVFARYLGVFSDIGHAWNDSDGTKGVSAETIECGLICFYGLTNLFLERLGHSDEPISHTDIQHMAIAGMFAFGGAIGLLLESKACQRMLYPSLDISKRTSMYNIMPALVVFFTGLLMSQHNQDSQFASDIHATWGYLFCVASIFRICTYLIMFLSPPSRVPKRPPSEVLVSFSLISGALIFMMSARHVVITFEHYQIDLMFAMSLSVVGALSVMMWTIFVTILHSYNHRWSTRPNQKLV